MLSTDGSQPFFFNGSLSSVSSVLASHLSFCESWIRLILIFSRKEGCNLELLLALMHSWLPQNGQKNCSHRFRLHHLTVKTNEWASIMNVQFWYFNQTKRDRDESLAGNLMTLWLDFTRSIPEMLVPVEAGEPSRLRFVDHSNPKTRHIFWFWFSGLR